MCAGAQKTIVRKSSVGTVQCFCDFQPITISRRRHEQHYLVGRIDRRDYRRFKLPGAALKRNEKLAPYLRFGTYSMVHCHGVQGEGFRNTFPAQLISPPRAIDLGQTSAGNLSPLAFGAKASRKVPKQRTVHPVHVLDRIRIFRFPYPGPFHECRVVGCDR
jgi:hypothetical protein